MWKGADIAVVTWASIGLPIFGLYFYLLVHQKNNFSVKVHGHLYLLVFQNLALIALFSYLLFLMEGVSCGNRIGLIVGFNIIFICISIRGWLLFFRFRISRKLHSQGRNQQRVKTSNLLEGSDGWFLRNRHLAEPTFLTTVLLSFIAVMLAAALSVVLTYGCDARETAYPIFLYSTFIPWVVLLLIIVWVGWTVEESFGIRRELLGMTMIMILTVIILLIPLNTYPDLIVLRYSLFEVGLIATLLQSLWSLIVSFRNSNSAANLRATIGIHELETLEQLLENRAGYESFRLFITKQFALENLMFWQRSKAFVAEFTQHDWQAVSLRQPCLDAAQLLIDDFIAETAPTPVNLSATVRNALMEKWTAEKEGARVATPYTLGANARRLDAAILSSSVTPTGNLRTPLGTAPLPDDREIKKSATSNTVVAATSTAADTTANTYITNTSITNTSPLLHPRTSPLLNIRSSPSKLPSAAARKLNFDHLPPSPNPMIGPQLSNRLASRRLEQIVKNADQDSTLLQQLDRIDANVGQSTSPSAKTATIDAAISTTISVTPAQHPFPEGLLFSSQPTSGSLSLVRVIAASPLIKARHAARGGSRGSRDAMSGFMATVLSVNSAGDGGLGIGPTEEKTGTESRRASQALNNINIKELSISRRSMAGRREGSGVADGISMSVTEFPAPSGNTLTIPTSFHHSNSSLSEVIVMSGLQPSTTPRNGGDSGTDNQTNQDIGGGAPQRSRPHTPASSQPPTPRGFNHIGTGGRNRSATPIEIGGNKHRSSQPPTPTEPNAEHGNKHRSSQPPTPTETNVTVLSSFPMSATAALMKTLINMEPRRTSKPPTPTESDSGVTNRKSSKPPTPKEMATEHVRSRSKPPTPTERSSTAAGYYSKPPTPTAQSASRRSSKPPTPTEIKTDLETMTNTTTDAVRKKGSRPPSMELQVTLPHDNQDMRSAGIGNTFEAPNHGFPLATISSPSPSLSLSSSALGDTTPTTMGDTAMLLSGASSVSSGMSRQSSSATQSLISDASSSMVLDESPQLSPAFPSSDQSFSLHPSVSQQQGEQQQSLHSQTSPMFGSDNTKKSNKISGFRKNSLNSVWTPRKRSTTGEDTMPVMRLASPIVVDNEHSIQNYRVQTDDGGPHRPQLTVKTPDASLFSSTISILDKQQDSEHIAVQTNTFVFSKASEEGSTTTPLLQPSAPPTDSHSRMKAAARLLALASPEDRDTGNGVNRTSNSHNMMSDTNYRSRTVSSVSATSTISNDSTMTSTSTTHTDSVLPLRSQRSSVTQTPSSLPVDIINPSPNITPGTFSQAQGVPVPELDLSSVPVPSNYSALMPPPTEIDTSSPTLENSYKKSPSPISEPVPIATLPDVVNSLSPPKSTSLDDHIEQKSPPKRLSFKREPQRKSLAPKPPPKPSQEFEVVADDALPFTTHSVVHLFIPALKEVYSLMVHDLLPRYLLSDEFKEFVQEYVEQVPEEDDQFNTESGNESTSTSPVLPNRPQIGGTEMTTTTILQLAEESRDQVAPIPVVSTGTGRNRGGSVEQTPPSKMGSIPVTPITPAKSVPSPASSSSAIFSLSPSMTVSPVRPHGTPSSTLGSTGTLIQQRASKLKTSPVK